MRSRLALAALPLVLIGGLGRRLRSEPFLDLGPPVARGEPAQAGVLRVMTLNLAHGRGTASHQVGLRRGRFAENLMAAGRVLAREAPDVAALQEADGPSVWSGHFDHVDAVGRFAGFDSVYRGTHAEVGWPGVTDYGTALLATTPLHGARSVAFDRNWRDSKGFVVATVEVPALGEVDVVSVHLDFLRAGVREQQVEAMVAELADRGRPLVVLGDLNCDRDAVAWGWLASALELRAGPPASLAPTYPSHRPHSRIDWVLVSPSLEIRSQRVVPDAVTDHLAIVAEIGAR